MKNALDVGQCDYDHGRLRALIETAGGRVERAHTSQEALKLLASGSFDLVLVNRVFDRTDEEGLELIRHIRSNPNYSALPVMLISNYEEAQTAAQAAGAVRGFGKDSLRADSTLELLRKYLSGSQKNDQAARAK